MACDFLTIHAEALLCTASYPIIHVFEIEKTYNVIFVVFYWTKPSKRVETEKGVPGGLLPFPLLGTYLELAIASSDSSPHLNYLRTRVTSANPNTNTMRECISIHIGQAGIQTGEQEAQATNKTSSWQRLVWFGNRTPFSSLFRFGWYSNQYQRNHADGMNEDAVVNQ